MLGDFAQHTEKYPKSPLKNPAPNKACGGLRYTFELTDVAPSIRQGRLQFAIGYKVLKASPFEYALKVDNFHCMLFS